MKSGKPKVWKWQILTVLEDGKWKDAVRIKFELRKEFGEHFGKPTLNAVRKHMQRCSP